MVRIPDYGKQGGNAYVSPGADRLNGYNGLSGHHEDVGQRYWEAGLALLTEVDKDNADDDGGLARGPRSRRPARPCSP